MSSKLYSTVFSKFLFILILFLSACAGEKNIDKPNVILIMTDDQGYGDLSCLGNPVLKTPHIDDIYKQSVRFSDFHVSPLCAPTRSALLTGRDALKAGGWTTTTDRSMIFPEIPTMAEAFTDAGYTTAMYGKWHLGAVPPYRPMDKGFQESLYEPGGMITMTAEHWRNDVIDPVYQHNGKKEKFKGYRTDIWFEEAKKWMKDQKDKQTPFFVYLATLAPHGPFWIPEEYVEPYRKIDSAEEKRPVAPFFGMINNIDQNIGKLEKFLEENDLRDNTILIFMTDNGGTRGVKIFNAGMRGSKGSAYDGGHRVPFFIRWPDGGIEGGKDIDVLAAHIDVYPTLADICGLKLPPENEIDGISLAPVLKEESSELPDRFLFVRRDNLIKKDPDYTPEKYSYQSGVIHGKWRLIDVDELYNIEEDPGQQNNIADAHPQIVKKMRDAQDDHWKEVYPSTFDRLRPILIPVEQEEEVMLTPLYNRPLNDLSIAFQQEVCRGKGCIGEWAIQVPEPGNYRFEIRRWPKEINGAIQSSLPEFTGEFVRHPAGKALDIQKVNLKVGDDLFEQAVQTSDKAVVFKPELEKGTYKLTSRFIDSKGQELSDSYFIYISLLTE